MFLSSSNGYVKQSPFLLQFSERSSRKRTREDILFQSYHEDRRKLQTFGSMNRHQRNTRFILITIAVSIGKQRHILQIILQEEFITLVHGLDRVQHTLAAVDGLVAIAALPSLGLTGGSAGRNQAAAFGAVFGVEDDLNGRVATGIKDLTRVNAFNSCHNYSLRLLGCDDRLKNNAFCGRVPEFLGKII